MVHLSRDAGYVLYTYYNYIDAWVVYIENTFGVDKSGLTKLSSEITSSKPFSRLKTDITYSNDLSTAYLRGQFTLSSMNKLPVKEHPELALSANMWLPVQAYYAIHGVGQATLIALGQEQQYKHRAFLAAFSNLVHSYFPSPLCARCDGGPYPNDYSYSGLNTTPQQISEQSNIATPNKSVGSHYLGKSLKTTRDRLIEERFVRERNGKSKGPKKKRLSITDKNQICTKIPPTSIGDLLYRMRVRSNYDSPDMYLFAYSNTQDAVLHYQNLLYLTNIIVTALDLIVEKKVGKENMEKLKDILTAIK